MQQVPTTQADRRRNNRLIGTPQRQSGTKKNNDTDTDSGQPPLVLWRFVGRQRSQGPDGPGSGAEKQVQFLELRILHDILHRIDQGPSSRMLSEALLRIRRRLSVAASY